MSLAKKVKSLLKERKITQEKFSADTGINRTTLMDSHRRRSSWRKSTLITIAVYLGMTLEELVDGTEAEDYI